MITHPPHDPVNFAQIRDYVDCPIVLVGMMAAGKSHLGQLLAGALDIPFIDTDKNIEQQAGTTIAGIFAQQGETAFRTMEAAVISDILTAPMGPCVVATGGGAVLNPQSADLIFGNTVSVWVRAKPETIIHRTANRNDRPLLKNGNPQKILQDLASVRDPIYARSDIVIDTDDSTPRWMLRALADALSNYYNKRDNHDLKG